ncbi:MAG: hypothetical protein EA398_16875 [Deltaproteobacteria bacterium]|nr:MAG: hypothetical protein EA398_16875 [Deltaproteobacteria bacterium]
MWTSGRSAHLFRLGGFPVRADIGAAFLLVLLLIIFGGQGPTGLLLGLVIAVITFMSVLLHELGHAVAVRRLGYGQSTIVFSFLGGVTQWRGAPTHGHSIRIAAAGPAVSLLLAMLSFGLLWVFRAAGVDSVLLLRLLWITGFLNVLWGVFNLLPIYPMDGGKIARSWMSMRLSATEARRRSLMLSGGTGVVLMFVAAAMGYVFVLLLMALLLLQNWREWQAMSGGPGRG